MDRTRVIRPLLPQVLDASTLHNRSDLCDDEEAERGGQIFQETRSHRRAALEILRDRAKALKARDRVSEACDVWREILRIRPGDEDATRELGIYGKPGR